MEKDPVDKPLKEAYTQLSPPLRLALTIVCLVIISAGMFAIRNILAPFLFAVVTGICAAPILSWLVRKKVPRLIAAVITLVVVVVIFAAIVLILLITPYFCAFSLTDATH